MFTISKYYQYLPHISTLTQSCCFVKTYFQFWLDCFYSEFFQQNLLSQLKLVLWLPLQVYSLTLVGRSGVNVALRTNKFETSSFIVCVLNTNQENVILQIFRQIIRACHVFKAVLLKFIIPWIKFIFLLLDQMTTGSDVAWIKCHLDQVSTGSLVVGLNVVAPF